MSEKQRDNDYSVKLTISKIDDTSRYNIGRNKNSNNLPKLWDDKLTIYPNIEFHPYAVVINKIRELNAHQWNINFMHTLHEDNFCADMLAKKGSSS